MKIVFAKIPMGWVAYGSVLDSSSQYYGNIIPLVRYMQVIYRVSWLDLPDTSATALM